ncbi:rhodanese-like domain-containing protein [Paenibacillus sp. sgz5001063]|uniref:rhodanese-like domain-containing protein n=1 Tax=Paenibacillus sp. sgz5001063 TaxID=3242474 RepID=UPI0036D435E6
MAFKITKEISPQKVAAQLKKGDSMIMLDVREPVEWAEGHIAGAKHIPLGVLLERLHELDPAQETIVMCRSGNRSGLACELLTERGFNVINMTGGLNNWTDEWVR